MKRLQNFFSRKDIRILSLGLLALVVGTASADAQVTAGLQRATTELTNYLPLVQKIVYAIAGLIFLIGGLHVFVKMSNGDQDVKNSIMMYVGGVVFLLIVGSIAPTLFR